MNLELNHDPKSSLVNQISEILAIARDKGQEGAVGSVLVGAKLSMRYQDAEMTHELHGIGGDSFGCFYIGDSVIFVLASLEEQALNLLIDSVENGKRVFVFTPSRLLPTYRKLFEDHKSLHITTGSIETFIATTIEELSGYRSDLIDRTFSELICRYNEISK